VSDTEECEESEIPRIKKEKILRDEKKIFPLMAVETKILKTGSICVIAEIQVPV